MLVEEIKKAMGLMGFDVECMNMFGREIDKFISPDLHIERKGLIEYFKVKFEEFGLIIHPFIIEIIDYTVDPIYWLADVIHYVLPHFHVNQYVYFKV